MIEPVSREHYILKRIIKSLNQMIDENNKTGKDSSQLYKLLEYCKYIEESYLKLDNEVYQLEMNLRKDKTC